MPYKVFLKSFILSFALIVILSIYALAAGGKNDALPFTSSLNSEYGKVNSGNLLPEILTGNETNNINATTDTSGIDIHYLRLDIKANDTTTYIEGMANYLVSATRDSLTDVILELSQVLTADSVFIDGVKALYIHQSDLLTITLSSLYSSGSKINISIYYHGLAKTDGYFSGISSGKDFIYGVPVTWTLSEPFGAKDWFPAKQVLTDKIDSVDMNITTPGSCLAGSNGRLTGITILADGGKCHHWKSRYPIDYYLISLTVANYQDYSIYAHPKGSKDSLLVQNYIYNLPTILPAVKAGIDRTAQFIELFANLFGPYPFDKEKYGHCLAPISGGMEHQTMTTLSGFDFGLVAHELCHMWFGDHITCGSWQDIWLNEGFATYGEYLAHQFIEGKSSGNNWIQHAHEEAMIIADGSVYIPIIEASNVNRIFNDALSYKKGASIIHMLRYEINDDSLFYSVLREYSRRFAYGTAVGEDFRKVAEEITGRDFQWFFNQWYYGEGYPIINISWNQKSRLISINTEQSPSASTPLFKSSMDVKLNFTQGDTTVRIWMDNIQNHFEFNSDKQLISVMADPDNWLLKKTTVIQLPQVTDFKMHPNPFSGQVQIDFYTGSKTRSFRLSDLNGRLLNEFTSTDMNITIDSVGLSQGIYLLNIIEGDKSWQLKIVKD